jgi:hypothetical protein
VSQTKHQRNQGLEFRRKVGRDRAHRRLVDELALKYRPVANVVNGMSECNAHETRRCNRAVDPCELYHSMIVNPAFGPDALAWAPRTHLDDAFDLFPNLSLSAEI